MADNPGAILLARQEQKRAVVRPSEEVPWSDKILHTVFLASLMLIVLVSGGILTTADIFPGPQIARAY